MDTENNLNEMNVMADTLKNSDESNINLNSLNTSEFGTVREAMGDWNNYGNESGFFTGHTMKNSPCGMEDGKDYWYVINICMSIDSFATQIAVNAFTKETFIRNRENGAWKVWSKLGNGCDADTVDGKHAVDFIQKKGVLFDVDVNNIRECGEYYIQRGTNSPVIPGYLKVSFGYNEKWVRQTCSKYNGSIMYMRNYDNGKWGPWIKLNDGGNADTLDGKHAIDFANSEDVNELKLKLKSLKDLIQSW